MLNTVDALCLLILLVVVLVLQHTGSDKRPGEEREKVRRSNRASATIYQASSVAALYSEMIGVIANGVEHSTIVEFFELFKTPWEFHRPGAQYDVLICSNSTVPENDARLLLLYGSQQQHSSSAEE